VRLTSRRDGRRGAVFPIVLWFAVAATGLAVALLETTRGSLPEGRRSLDAARLRAAVRAAVHLTAERLAAERLELGPEGGRLSAELDGVALEVEVRAESGLVELATASPDLLRRLARASGFSPDRADILASAIERARTGRAETAPAASIAAGRGAGDALRPPAKPGLDHPIELVAAALPGGVEPGENAAVERWLALTTLGTGRNEPLPEFAPALVRAALADRREEGTEAPRTILPGAPEPAASRRSDPAGLYRLRIVARTESGRVAVRTARIALRAGEAKPVHVVDWSAPLVLPDRPSGTEGS
jgi:hypothetical protein